MPDHETSATPSATLSATIHPSGTGASRVRLPAPSPTEGDALSESRSTATTERDSHSPKPWFQHDEITWHYPDPTHPSTNAFPRSSTRRQRPCPTCGAPPTANCVTRSGNPKDGNHKARSRERQPHGSGVAGATPWTGVDVDLDAIRARLVAASEGPWEAKPHQSRRNCLTVQQVTVDRKFIAHYISSEVDAEFIAHARTDVERLLAALDEARANAARWAGAWERANGMATEWRERGRTAERRAEAAESALSAVRAGIDLLLADLAKAEPRHFSIGLMGVRVKGLAALATPTTPEETD